MFFQLTNDLFFMEYLASVYQPLDDFHTNYISGDFMYTPLGAYFSLKIREQLLCIPF